MSPIWIAIIVPAAVCVVILWFTRDKPERYVDYEPNLVAAGGWCVPADFTPLLASEVLSVTEDMVLKPDVLPKMMQSSRRVEYIIEPSEDYYGTPEMYDTLEEATAAFDKRVAQNDELEGCWITKRHSQDIVLRASHGTYVADPDTPEHKGGFPEVSAQRGGIPYQYSEHADGLHLKRKED